MTHAYNAASILYTARCTDTVSLQTLCLLTTAGQYTSGSPHDATTQHLSSIYVRLHITCVFSYTVHLMGEVDWNCDGML